MELDLDVLPKGPLKLNLDVLPRGPLKMNFGRASQRSDGLEGIIHTDVCGPFTLIPAKYILSISNRVYSLKRLWHTWRMPLVWDLLHASMNAEGG